MILLRGIRGEQYARKIQNGFIGFRDLLSTLLNTNYTGYNFSDYTEDYVNSMLCKMVSPPLNYDAFNKTDQENMALLFHPIVPYIYLTYFHILNADSQKWLKEFDDDMKFIFIEPRIDPVSKNLIGDKYVGRKLDYIENCAEADFMDFLGETNGILQFIDEDIKNGVNYELAINYASYVASLMLRLFTRVTNKKYTRNENEYRIVLKIPTVIDSSIGGFFPETKRRYDITINNNEYTGEMKAMVLEIGILSFDIFLKAKRVITNNQKIFFTEEVLKGSTYKLNSDFLDVDLKGSLLSFGYIGDKHACRRFIQENS